MTNQNVEVLKILIRKVNDRNTLLDDKLLNEIVNNLNNIFKIIGEDKNYRELMQFINAAKGYKNIKEREKFKMSILNGLQNSFDRILIT
ncbi:MAG: hypothetical protein ACOC16_00750 [Nanoarchaeota archaeon]